MPLPGRCPSHSIGVNGYHSIGARQPTQHGPTERRLEQDEEEANEVTVNEKEEEDATDHYGPWSLLGGLLGGYMLCVVSSASAGSSWFVLFTVTPPPLPSGSVLGVPPQKANTYLHPEVPTGILFQPLWHPPPLEDPSRRLVLGSRTTLKCPLHGSE